MRYYILQKLWHEYLGTKANDIKQDACHGNLSLRSCYFCWRARGYAFSQTLFRFRRSFANAFFNKTHQLGRLIRYLPNFHDTPCFPPPSPANFFFFISIILNFSLKVMQNVWRAQGAIWKMCIWSVNLV